MKNIIATYVLHCTHESEWKQDFEQSPKMFYFTEDVLLFLGLSSSILPIDGLNITEQGTV